MHQQERAEVGQGEHRSDRKVDAADNDYQPHSKADEADLSSLAGGVREARRRKKVLERAAKDKCDDDSKITGIAVSVQRLERISPRRWSGHQRNGI